MSTRLAPCTRCGRHLRAGTERCPFCALGAATKRAATVAAAVAVGVGLSACYGGPSRRDNLERYDRDAYPPSTASTAPPPESAGPVDAAPKADH
jgi:hypothetical protein